MSAMTTLAPVRANATAVARPMPLDPPVTTITRVLEGEHFLSSPSITFWVRLKREPSTIYSLYGWGPEPYQGHDSLPARPNASRTQTFEVRKYPPLGFGE